MEKTRLDRINELAHIAKMRPLTEEEIAERDVLRKEYIAEWRRGAEQTLESLYILDKNGNEVKLPKKKGC